MCHLLPLSTAHRCYHQTILFFDVESISTLPERVRRVSKLQPEEMRPTDNWISWAAASALCQPAKLHNLLDNLPPSRPWWLSNLDNRTDCVTDVTLPGDWAGSPPQVVSLQLVSQDTFTTTAVPAMLDADAQARLLMHTTTQPAVDSPSTGWAWSGVIKYANCSLTFFHYVQQTVQ